MGRVKVDKAKLVTPTIKPPPVHIGWGDNFPDQGSLSHPLPVSTSSWLWRTLVVAAVVGLAVLLLGFVTPAWAKGTTSYQGHPVHIHMGLWRQCMTHNNVTHCWSTTMTEAKGWLQAGVVLLSSAFVVATLGAVLLYFAKLVIISASCIFASGCVSLAGIGVILRNYEQLTGPGHADWSLGMSLFGACVTCLSGCGLLVLAILARCLGIQDKEEFPSRPNLGQGAKPKVPALSKKLPIMTNTLPSAYEKKKASQC